MSVFITFKGISMGINHSYGTNTGIDIELTGAEITAAVVAWLAAHEVHITGPCNLTVNGQLCVNGKLHVDGSGSVRTPTTTFF
jgi:hypothetical protein